MREPPQAALDGAHDVMAVERPLVLAHRRQEPAAARSGDLGRDEQRVARLAGHPLADDLLAAPGVLAVRRHRVDLGDVEEVDAGIEGAVEDGAAGPLVGLIAEGHGAQADLRNDQAGAAKTAMLHAITPARN